MAYEYAWTEGLAEFTDCGECGALVEIDQVAACSPGGSLEVCRCCGAWVLVLMFPHGVQCPEGGRSASPTAIVPSARR